MYNLPPDFNGKKLIGLQLDVISFGIAHFHLQFSETVWIQVMSGFSHSSKDELLDLCDAFPVTSTTLLRLLGYIVTDFTWDIDNDLCITFSNGDRLLIVGSDQMYECYIIYDGKRQVIV